MKKFKFPLDKVLDFKTHIQKKEKDVLALLRSEYDKLVEEDVRLFREYERAKRSYEERSERGVSVRDTAVMLNHMAILQSLLKEQKKRIADKKSEIDSQSKKLLEITQEKMTVEKLKEKHLEVYMTEQRRSDEKFIEEFIANKNAAGI